MCDNDDNVALVDWQFCARSFALNDVALFLYSSMEPDERRQHTPKLLRQYFQHFSRHARGVGTHLTLDDVQRRYRLARNHAIYVALLSGVNIFRADAPDRMLAAVHDVLRE